MSTRGVERGVVGGALLGVVRWFVLPWMHYDDMCDDLLVEWLRVAGPQSVIAMAERGFGSRGTLYARLAVLAEDGVVARTSLPFAYPCITTYAYVAPAVDAEASA